MKKLTASLTLLLLILSFTEATGQGKIELSPEMLINLSTRGDASLLVNEQSQSGDPKTQKNSYIPTGNFFGGYGKLYYPIKVVVDLKAKHKLTDLYVFDTHNKDSIRVFTGSPGNWKWQGNIFLGTYNRWRKFEFNDEARYVLLEFRSTKSNISEIALYGKALEAKEPVPQKTTHQLPLFENLMGVNGLHNQPLNKLMCFGTVREYHPWQWDEGNTEEYEGYPNNQFGWNPSWVGGKWPWNFDKTYKNFKLVGVEVSPCLQRNAPYMLYEDGKKEWKPISKGDDPEDPRSYIEHSRYLYQFAARYGSTKVSPDALMLKPGNARISGLGLVKYLENWNEPDKWWRGRKGYFSPFELAAMCSADYDGHEGSLGSGYGAKTADPNLKFVMGGLAEMSVDYIKSMKLWSDTHRKTGFPADVINFHHYSNTSGGQQGGLKEAISPEDDSLKYKLREIVNYRDLYLPGKEIWLSEFGYDTNPNSPQGVKTIGDADEFEIQARWLVRSFLEIAAAGLDRAHVYFFADVNSKNPNKFNSSGVVNEKWFKFQPKVSWYYLYGLKNTLSGYRFSNEIVTTNNDVNVYKFEHASNGTCVYAAWCKTSSDKRIDNYTIDIGSESAELYELQAADVDPSVTPLEVSQKSVSVSLSEKPIFIKANR